MLSYLFQIKNLIYKIRVFVEFCNTIESKKLHIYNEY